MDDAAVMGVLEGGRDLAGQFEDLAPRQPAALLENGVEAGAGDVLHGEPRPTVTHSGVEKADDVGVVEPANNFDLALEAKDEALFDGEFRRQHLDGDDGRPIGRRRVGVREVDAGHAAASDFLVEDPRAESCADHVRRTTGRRRAVVRFRLPQRERGCQRRHATNAPLGRRSELRPSGSGARSLHRPPLPDGRSSDRRGK